MMKKSWNELQFNEYKKDGFMFLENIKRSFGLDYRSLSLYRVLLGLIIVIDVLYRMPDITAFYSDVGILPRQTFLSEFALPWSFSLHLASGSTEVLFIFFLIQLIIGLMVLFGYKTRWALLFSYILNVSVHNRNWLINNGGDDVLRAILFLSIFLPLDKFFSVDAARREGEKSEAKYVTSPWTMAFFIQVFAIYFVSYILKDHPVWRGEYTAVYYALRVDALVNPLGHIIREIPWFDTLTTIFTIFLEWAGPLFLLLSFIFLKHWWIVRFLVVLGFWGLHLGIILTMWIGLFPYICITMWCLFIPTPVWDYLERKFYYGPVTINYDKDCGFCFKMVSLIRHFFLTKESMILPCQDRPHIQAIMERENSWVVEDSEGNTYTAYEAFITIVRHSWFLRPFSFLLASRPARFLGNKIYRWVSQNRSLMGKFSQFFIFLPPRKEVLTLRILSSLFGVFICVTLVMWNLTTIKRFHVNSPFFADVTRWLHLYQEWNMFSPRPKPDSVWIEIPAVLTDGSEIELLTGDRDIYSVKNKAFFQSIPSEHWRKLYFNLTDRIDYGRYFGSYLCRNWNDLGNGLIPEVKLRKLEINIYSQMNLLNNQKEGVVKKATWTQWCFDKDAS